MRLFIIGAGGIGSAIIPQTAKFCKGSKITLIDGDKFEEKNLSRQFGSVGNSKVSYWEDKYDNIEGVNQYVNEKNIGRLIPSKEKAIILMGVDNHKTRKVVQQHCLKMKDVVLISGGNELKDGDVRIFIREKYKDLTKPIWFMQPEIEHPTDRSPDEVGCSEMIESKPQIIMTNNFVGAVMLNALYAAYSGKSINYSVVYVDILQNKINQR